MIIKMIQELRKRMDAQSEKAQDVFNKELENIKGNQVELKNTIILVKNMLLLPLLLLSHSSRVRLCATPQTAATRLPRPWDSPGKNTGVGCHFLLQ